MACSAVLSTAPAPDTRRTVTVVFSDLVGSTKLGEALDPESVREALASYFQRMQAVLERHGGTVEKYIGDAVMAVFGLPRLHEDDALRAVRAAWEMQAALGEVNDLLAARWGVRLESRTGVHTGEVVAGDPATGQRLVTGDTVNTAARLEQAAPPGGVLLGETTWRLVRGTVLAEPVEPLTLKGKAERVPAYRLHGLEQAAPADRPDGTPMVGRHQELQRLEAALAGARDQARCELVVVVGDPGVGKSRLLREFTGGLGGVRVLAGRCPAYGEGITLWPLAEAVRQAAGISADAPQEALARLRRLLGGHAEAEFVAERVAACAGAAGDAFPIEEIFWAVRQLVEHLASVGPVVLVFDDLHWAEDAFLSFLEQTASPPAQVPVLVVCSARHDLLELRPRWADRFPVIGLEALPAEQTDLLVAARLGSSGVPAAVQARVRDAAGGNPLFVEQILSMLVDEGHLERNNGSWVVTGDVSALAIPPTISALLAARLDGLSAEEREVVGHAAVPGVAVERAALAELCPDELRSRLDPVLAALVHKQLLQAENGTYRFGHVLIRDAAYAGLLKRRRAELHERYAGWLDGPAAGPGHDVEELSGYHLEQAYRHRAELGPLDAAGMELGRRAAARLAAAGTRALHRGDVAAAANLLGRAVGLDPGDTPEQLAWRIDLGGALRESNQLREAADVLDAAMASARSGGDVRLEARAVVERIATDQYLETPGWADQALRAAERLIPLLEAAGDHQGLAKVWRMMSWVHFEDSLARWDEASWRSIEHARQAGDRREEVEVLAGLAINASMGAVPAPEGIQRCLQLLDDVRGNLRAEGFVRSYLADLYSLVGDFALAREASRHARAAVEKSGVMVWSEPLAADAADIERLAGDPVAAEREVRDALRQAQVRGNEEPTPGLGTALAQALYEQGRYGEALELAGEALAAAQGLWRTTTLAVWAKALARLGRREEALAAAMEVAEQASRTDYVVLRAEAFTDAAEALLLAGHPQQAQPVLRDARRLAEAKESIVLTQRVQRLIDGRLDA
jgi:class 3 adenylate cyclase/tetratricopeptide (TPR) repeat protein